MPRPPIVIAEPSTCRHCAMGPRHQAGCPMALPPAYPVPARLAIVACLVLGSWGLVLGAVYLAQRWLAGGW